MSENRFDEAMEEISVANGLNWTDDSKVRLFARFLEEGMLVIDPLLFERFENFLSQKAQEELCGEDFIGEEA